MADPAVILAVSGSLRAESYNTKLLAEAAAVAPVGAKLVPWGDLASIPAFSEDNENDTGAAVHALRAAIAEAGAVLIATPEYNGSLPGQLKNALDWASRPFPDNVLRNKPALPGAAETLMPAIGALPRLHTVPTINTGSPCFILAANRQQVSGCSED